MNVVKEIQSINKVQLQQGGDKGSWHDQYKDSAYIYVGGLPHNLTEGDIITIFSQYGEVVDISMPRDQNTQKPKGFAFLMYADQRSTVLAVDNLGGSKVLERTLKVDHVLNYKQLERDEETGKMKERETERLAAHPDKFRATTAENIQQGEDSDDSHPSIDLDDPMRDYLIKQKRAARKAGPTSRKRIKRDDEAVGETKEERRARREAKRRAKEEREKKRSDRHRNNSRADDYDARRGEPRREPNRSSRSENDRRRDDRESGRYREERHDGRENSRFDNSGRSRDDDDGYKSKSSASREGKSSSFADLENWAKSGRG